MGADIAFGVCIGIPLWELLIDLPIEWVKISTFDRYTGKPSGTENVQKDFVQFNYPLFNYKVGDKMEWRKFRKKMEQLVYENNSTTYKLTPEITLETKIIFTTQVLGIKAFKGREPYESPQDLVLKFVPNKKEAIHRWEELFPEIPYQYLFYLKYSY